MDIPTKYDDDDDDNNKNDRLTSQHEGYAFHQNIMKEIHDDGENDDNNNNNKKNSSSNGPKRNGRNKFSASNMAGKNNNGNNDNNVSDIDSGDDMFGDETENHDNNNNNGDIDTINENGQAWRDMAKKSPNPKDVLTWGLKTMLGPATLHEWNTNSFGDYNEEMINRVTHEIAYSTPMPMDINSFGTVVEVASTRNVVVMLLQDGRLVAYSKDFEKPSKIHRMVAVKQRVLHVSAGLQHFAAVVLTVDPPNLMTWGKNNFGQLGLGHKKDSKKPEMVKKGTIKDVMVGNVFCGENSTFAICTDGRLFAWGDNRYGQLGIGAIDEATSLFVPDHINNVQQQQQQQQQDASTTGEDDSGMVTTDDEEIDEKGSTSSLSSEIKSNTKKMKKKSKTKKKTTKKKKQKKKKNASKNVLNIVTTPVEVHEILFQFFRGKVCAKMLPDKNALILQEIEKEKLSDTFAQMKAKSNSLLNDQDAIDTLNLTELEQFFPYNKDYVEKMFEEKRFHPKSWRRPKSDKSRLNFNGDQLQAFEEIMRERVEMQRSLLKVEQQIIKLRQNGGKERKKKLGSSNVNQHGSSSGNHVVDDEDGTSTSMFSINNDKTYQQAKLLLVRYELEENDVVMSIRKLDLEIQPLNEEVEIEEKKVEENLIIIQRIESEIIIAQEYKKAGNDRGAQMRNREISNRQRRDMLQGRRQYHETTAIGTYLRRVCEAKRMVLILHRLF